MESESREVHPNHFNELVAPEIVALIQTKAPTKVWSRVLKAIDHVEKAKLLDGIDDEMGAIRLIAAEEELVVAIFEWLKLNGQKMPEHRDIVKMFKNHQVKLMFYPVLSSMRFALNWMIESGLSPAGLDHLRWTLTAGVHEGELRIVICDEEGNGLLKLNPLNMFITKDDASEDEVIAELFHDLVASIQRSHGIDLKAFVFARSEYRNKLLYAEDGGYIVGGDTVAELLSRVFNDTFQDLLWCLAVLLNHSPQTPHLGLVSQFLSVYREVLIATKVLRPGRSQTEPQEE